MRDGQSFAHSGHSRGKKERKDFGCDASSAVLVSPLALMYRTVPHLLLFFLLLSGWCWWLVVALAY